MWAEPSSLLIVSFWAAWYAQHPSINWLGVAFALVLAAAFIRSAQFVHADKKGTWVHVDGDTLVVEDLGRRHAWQCAAITRVSAARSAHGGARLLVRTVDGLEEVITFRDLPQLRALAAEVHRALVDAGALDDPSRAPPPPRDDLVLDYSSHPPSNRGTVTRGPAGDTVIFLRAQPAWRRVAGRVAVMILLIAMLMAGALAEGSSRLQRVAGCSVIAAILLLLVASLPGEFRGEQGTTIRVDGSDLAVTVAGRERRWPWAQIADVGVGPDPQSDSNQACLLVRLEEHIDATLHGETPAELNWVSAVIHRDRPRPHRNG